MGSGGCDRAACRGWVGSVLRASLSFCLVPRGLPLRAHLLHLPVEHDFNPPHTQSR